MKTEINKLRKFDFKTAAEQTIDPDGTIRDAMSTVDGLAKPAVVKPVPVVEETPDSPAFVPPDAA